MSVTAPAGGFIVIVSFDPLANPPALATFRARYGVPPSVAIFGPYSGKLSNANDLIELFKPDPPQLPPHPDAGLVPAVLVDAVKFSDAAPWPADADGTGKSLQRRASSDYGNDPINWLAGQPTAGRSNSPGSPDTDGDSLPDDWEEANGLDSRNPVGDQGRDGDPDRDGLTNWQEYVAGTLPQNSQSYLRIDSIETGAEGITIRFSAAAGKSYSLQFRENLTGGGWMKVQDFVAQPESRIVAVTVAAGDEANGGYFRLVTPAP